MSITNDEFRAALGRFASGVTVITTSDATGFLHGITVSAFCSLSLSPPLVLICIEKTAGSHYALIENGFFAVNILREDQQHYSDRFASEIPDKFSDIEYYENNSGVPVLKSVLVNLECKIVNIHDAGDHTIFVGQIEETIIREGNPLVYFHGKYWKIDDGGNFPS